MSRTSTRALAIVAALALGAVATPVFAQDEASPIAEASPAVEASPTAGASTEPLAEATLTPSGETAAGLIASLPTQIGSLDLVLSSFEAAAVLANVESDELVDKLADLALAHDTELDQLALAGGVGVDDEVFVSIIGGRLPGVPADALQESFIELVLGPIEPELVEPGTVAGQEVSVIRASADAGPDDTAYVLPAGEVVWLVIADETSLEAALEALAANG